MKKSAFLTALACLFITINLFSQVTMRDTILKWRHFDYELNEFNQIASYNENLIVDRFFNAKIIENKYIKLTLLPEFGGRILSYIYKPTGHDQLYQNPVGAPYGIGENSFYYDWLMVYGGIFPTFPEAEHGKTWLLPWESQILTNTSDQITFQMSFTDDININTSGQFNNGQTNITCHFTVSVFKDRSDIKLDISIVNPNNYATIYEYWTNGTLSPGSEIGDTKCPGNSEIIADIDYVRLLSNWWPWMGDAEEYVQETDQVYKWNNLATYSNWDGWGIAYANPSNPLNYHGLINHENEEGIFRVADADNNVTPGLKMWTFGHDRSYAADTTIMSNLDRPFIELWTGNSNEFFWDATIPANSTIAWEEYYMPTVGLPSITEINHDVAILLDTTGENISASIFGMLPNTEVNVIMKLNGNKNYTIHNNNVVFDPSNANVISFVKNDLEVDAGNYIWEVLVEELDGTNLITASIDYTQSINPNKVYANFSAASTAMDVTFADSSIGSIASYVWDFGTDATPEGATSAGTHDVSYSTTGLKTITLTVTGATGLTSTFSKTITVLDEIFTDCDPLSFNNSEILNFTRGLCGDNAGCDGVGANLEIDDFAFAQNNGTLEISSYGGYNIWSHTAIEINDGISSNPIDLSGNPNITIRAKSSVNMTLEVTLLDTNNGIAWNNNIRGQAQTVTPNWTEFTYTISDASDAWNGTNGVDLTQVKYILLKPNNGTGNDFGTLHIDYIEIANPATANCIGVYDCSGEWNGEAYVDDCDECVGGNTNFEACTVAIVENKNTTNIIKLYPNPVNGLSSLTINAHLLNTEPINIEVLSIQGTVVQSKYIDLNQNNVVYDLPLDDHTPGIYIVKISGENWQENRRIAIW